MNTKICVTCLEKKQLSEFGKHSKMPDGLQAKCRDCISEYASSRRLARTTNDLPISTGTVVFGDTILIARTEKGLTQKQVGDIIGVTSSQVTLWEKGKSVPTQNNMQALITLLGIEVPLELKANNEGRLPVGVSNCAFCSTPFPQYKARVIYCSKTCMGKALSIKQKGEDNKNWKGGKYRLISGYRKIKAPDNHPNADISGYILEHRLNLERKLGRLLEPYERVHHKNGDRLDNSQDNLELWVVVGSSKKDPAGQRMEDLLKTFLAQPEIIDPVNIELAFRRVFRF